MEFKNVSHDLGEIAKNYDYRQPPDILLRLQDLLAYINRFLRDLFSMLKLPQFGNADSRGVADLMQVLVIIAGVVGAVMVLLLVASRLRTLQAQRNLALGSIVVGDSPLDSVGWLKLAQELENNQSHREACRAIYMSVLHLLDERNVVPFSATRSNYEYFYALKRMQSVAESFRRLVDSVEYIWFGDKQANNDDFRYCMEQSRLVQDGLPLKAVNELSKAGR